LVVVDFGHPGLQPVAGGFLASCDIIGSRMGGQPFTNFGRKGGVALARLPRRHLGHVPHLVEGREDLGQGALASQDLAGLVEQRAPMRAFTS